VEECDCGVHRQVLFQEGISAKVQAKGEVKQMEKEGMMELS
jgi:hypothetical protein